MVMTHVHQEIGSDDMYKIQESEFDAIEQTVEPKLCKHSFVKLYDLGTHSDYGCVLCKIKTLTPEKYVTNPNN